LFQRFADEGIPLVLAGGWAVCFHGYSRTTLDIDYICRREQHDSACSLMERLGFERKSDGMASRFKHAIDPSIPFTDLIWVDNETFRVMAETAVASPEPLSVSMLGLRSLVAMKLHALKDGASRDHKDLLDLRKIIARNPGQIRHDELRLMCHRYATPEAFDQILGPT
jgi:hypothetical protein